MLYTITNISDLKAINNNIVAGDTLYFKKGTYHIKLSLNIDNLTIIGEDRDNTIITNNDHYHKIMPDFNECNTFRTYTLQLLGSNNKLENITINNSSSSKKYGQAVALAVYGDNFIANNCSISGEQDTLFTGPLPNDLKIRYQDFLPTDVLNKNISRQQYTNCIISGDIDFIFGGAMALFKDCIIKCQNSKGYVSAPSHDISVKYGYLFYNCNILTPDNSNFYLARPWRDYGLVHFINCSYSNGISPLGFDKWNDSNRDKTCRFYEYSITKYPRVSFLKQLSEKEANNYYCEFVTELNK